MVSSDVLPVKVTLPSKTVQELVSSTAVPHVPDRYVFYPNTDANASVLTYMDTPIIDLQLLLDDSSPLAKQELLNLRDSITSWGCFQLVNHGVASSLIDQLNCAGKDFFALPAEEKQKYSRTVHVFEGYGNDVVYESQLINWNDRLHLRIQPVEQRNMKLWPDIVPNFRETLDKYSIQLKRVLEILLKAFAKSINLDENAFLNEYGEDGSFYARFNYYPPCPNADQVVGLRPHTDATLITILVQDEEVEGLQLLKDDQWYKVPVIPNALFVNLGDQLEILSNGILKSPTHKTIVDKEKARMSVASPSTMHHDKEFGPLRELIDTNRPKLYKNVTNYMTTYLESIARGEIPIDAIKIKQ